MKKILIVLCVAGFIVSLASPLMAGGIINKQNFSSEYLRTFSRNAATDAADIMVFNPAGVMKKEDGFYGNLGLFYADKDYSNTVPVLGELDSKEPSIIPGLFTLYKKDKWAGFFAFTIPGGGGIVDYKDGNATTLGMAAAIIGSPIPFDTYESSSIKANSVYRGYTFGGAYTINDLVSVSAGLRFVDALKEADVTTVLSVGGLGATPINVEFEQTANGWGGFLGLNYSPREDLNFGFRYETATELDFESNVKNDDTGGLAGAFDPRLIDGNKIREDLPGLIGLGAAYTINPKIKLDLSLTYYLEKSAKFEEDRLKDAGDSWDLALAGEYTFNPQLRASAGYMYTKTGIDADDMSPENPELGANTLCAGMAWEPMDKMTLNFAILNSFYNSDKTSTGIKYEKNVFGVGFGIEYKFK
jgi:long-chain fatty acid transport protein